MVFNNVNSYDIFTLYIYIFKIESLDIRLFNSSVYHTKTNS
jgi:hypothetical protein